MKLPELKIGDKIARIPIIQGGMGVGISLGNLAGAVAREGGVGIISSAQIGFREPDFETNRLEANSRAIKKEYDKARKIAPNGIIGFNIMVALREYKQHVIDAIKAGADLIISGAGLPTELPAIAGDANVKLAPIVSTEKSARVILKYWDRKYNRTADMIVIEGPRAGGHLGFTKEQLDEYLPENTQNQANCGGREKYEDEIQKIMKIVETYAEKYECHIPVVLAGGISDKADVNDAFALGADGVQVATRFVTTEECDADIRYKQAYINASKEDIVIVKSPVGMPGRAILNPFMKRVKVEGKVEHSPCHGCLARCNPAEIPYCITDGLVNAAKGDVDNALLFCGADAYKATRIETVREVMNSLAG
ncbi:MAG: nitronate monooxygenase family protein [Hespellia sp.]|nr:nitronate monooxygenase family protein [Hespellia sp.]